MMLAQIEFVGLKQYFGYRQLRKGKLFDPKHEIEIGLDTNENEIIVYIETDQVRKHRKMLHSLKKMVKNDKRKVIGRKWLLMMMNKYNEIYQETMFSCYCEEIDRFKQFMLMLFSFFTSKNFGMNSKGEFRIHTP